MKIRKIKLLDFIVFLFTFAFAFVGISVSVSVLNFKEIITDYPLFVLIYFIILFALTLRYKQIPKFSRTLVFFYILILAVAISLLKNGESLLTAVNIFMIILIINRCSYIGTRGVVLLSAIALATVPYFRISSLSNSMGINFCLIGIAFLYELYLRKKYNLVLVCGFVFEYLLISTYSRASILIFTIIFLYYIYQILGTKSGRFRKVIHVFFFLAIIVVLFVCYDIFYDFFTNKWSASDVSSGRLRIWLGTLSNGITFFGNGENYFIDNFGKGDSHNIFIEILGRYGAVASLFFVCFTVSLFRRAIRSKDMSSILFLTAYYMLGMMENILFLNTRMIVPTIIFYFYVHRIIQDKSSTKDFNDTNQGEY